MQRAVGNRKASPTAATEVVAIAIAKVENVIENCNKMTTRITGNW